MNLKKKNLKVLIQYWLKKIVNYKIIFIKFSVLGYNFLLAKFLKKLKIKINSNNFLDIY